MNIAPITYLDELESESIAILRETASQFTRPVLMYSMGKDSSVLVRLAQKAFSPAPFPFPLLHIDTGYDFPEVYQFRDTFVKSIGAKLLVHRNEEAIQAGAHPSTLGMRRCCQLLRTQALLDALTIGGFDAAIGGARRDEERARAKERIFSFRDTFGQWDPRNQRPELWRILNGKINKGESVRVFPLSNWTERDIWSYIAAENIPLVPLYYAHERKLAEQGGQLLPIIGDAAGVVTQCRFRTVGCTPCTGAVRSSASSPDQIIDELDASRSSERVGRTMDEGGSMELNKREGCF